MRRCTKKKKSLMLLRTKPSERLPWFTSLISALTSDTPFINAIEHALSLDTRPHRTPPVLTLPSVVVCVRDKEDRCVFVPPSLCTASLQEKNNNNKKKKNGKRRSYAAHMTEVETWESGICSRKCRRPGYCSN